MSFRHDWVLFFLAIQLLFWMFLYFKKDSRRNALYATSYDIYKFLSRKVNLNSIKIKNRLIFLGLFFLTIAASGPQIGTRVRPVERKGVDLVIVLDTSKSMDANDVTPSRLSKAKFELNNLIKTLVVIGFHNSFCWSSHLYLPLTTDYEAHYFFWMK